MIKYYKGQRINVKVVLHSGYMYAVYGDSHGWLHKDVDGLTDGFEIYLTEIEKE